MNNACFLRLIFIGIITFSTANIMAAQGGVQERSITSDDFINRRPARIKSSATPRRTYKPIRVDKTVIRPKSGAKVPVPKPVPATAKYVTTEIGVTMWKLRPPRPEENGYMFQVVDSNKVNQMWLAERIAVDTNFKIGDKVRFAVESSTVGYLYVIDREIYSDGSYGEPFQLFPESMRDDNSVGPGTVVEFRDQRQEYPYFNINSKNANYSGEVMTVIVTPVRITNIETDKEGKILNSEVLSNYELGYEAQIFSREDTAEKIYSKAESESACGAKLSQSLLDKSPARPCGIKSRQLTREESQPQSIYRVKGIDGQPVVVMVRLVVKQ